MSGPKGYAVVTGAQKLVQDLRFWILEPQGTDPMHPTYGSALDGGVRRDGTLIDGLIGTNIIRERLLEVESEVRRILYAYQDLQLQRLRRENQQYDGMNTFAPNEILYSVDDVTVDQFDDRLVTRVKMRTQNNFNLALIQPVE